MDNPQQVVADALETSWRIFGKRVPKPEVVYIAQVVLIYIVVVTCIVNLSLGREDCKVWFTLLGSSIGYLLPHPTPTPKKGANKATPGDEKP